MNIREIIQSFRSDPVETRDLDPSSSFPDWDTQVMAALGMWTGAWGPPTVTAALSSPSIFRAVSLISNTTGSLAVETYRDGVLLTGSQVPRMVTRPDPFRTARVFYRDSAYYLATRGECWWWVAKRDGDNLPMSLIVVPPWEITVDPGTNRLKPTIKWLDRTMRNEDMRQITFLPNETGLRGVGPLQLCGAAVSVAVESQRWAANFYAAGGMPSLGIQAAGTLGTDPDTNIPEADTIKAQFSARAPNTPFVYDEGIADVKEFQTNEQGAQMLDARQANKGDAANMFGIPGVLLEYSAPGSSLTYQNVQEVFRLFVKSSLLPNYLEPIQQEMSDLLPRSTTAVFNLDGFERADPMARWQTYEVMTRVLGAEEAAAIARQGEGLTPGDVEFMPVPFAPPQAFPTRLPIARSAEPVRCNGKRFIGGRRQKCNKLLAEAGPFTGRCPRCGTEYVDEVVA